MRQLPPQAESSRDRGQRRASAQSSAALAIAAASTAAVVTDQLAAAVPNDLSEQLQLLRDRVDALEP